MQKFVRFNFNFLFHETALFLNRAGDPSICSFTLVIIKENKIKNCLNKIIQSM